MASGSYTYINNYVTPVIQELTTVKDLSVLGDLLVSRFDHIDGKH